MSMGKNVLVLDGQGELVGMLAGRPAQEAALQSFVHGLRAHCGDTPKPMRSDRGGLIADADQLSAPSW